MEIVNRIEKSGLIQVDLKEYLAANSLFMGFDFKPTLWNELALREKDFREFCKTYDWLQYKGKYVYLFCSVDAILPSWAFLLITAHLGGIAQKTVVGDLQEAKKQQLLDAIEAIDLSNFTDGKLIVKGCSEIPSPEQLLSAFVAKVQPVVASILFGEPCSTVPLYKRLKK